MASYNHSVTLFFLHKQIKQAKKLRTQKYLILNYINFMQCYQSIIANHLLICGSSGSSFDLSSITSIIIGILMVIPSKCIVDLLRLPNPSTSVHTVAPEILAPIKKSINTFSNRLPLNWSFFFILMVRHHIFCIIPYLFSHLHNCNMIVEAIILPAYTAPIDKPTFDNVFIAVV